MWSCPSWECAVPKQDHQLHRLQDCPCVGGMGFQRLGATVLAHGPVVYMFPVVSCVPSCFTCSQLFYVFPVVSMFPVVLCVPSCFHVPSCFTCSQLHCMFPVVLYVPSCIACSQFLTCSQLVCVFSADSYDVRSLLTENYEPSDSFRLLVNFSQTPLRLGEFQPRTNCYCLPNVRCGT